eukprot:gnl/MRDRNA2_/MRDRNA2_56388_c0_seq1.p1 gnl/MRDRNA2_/MRDRNA2_56388_c0~~gnl/MRDRNA2_/MRDRNA2_56388_c0_seq1.p1  ORF type:complete len:672 (-),score=103.48 gnl/MRDRNA2_/MRDRNA2_56388_c0_seq1:48-2063(-)
MRAHLLAWCISVSVGWCAGVSAIATEARNHFTNHPTTTFYHCTAPNNNYHNPGMVADARILNRGSNTASRLRSIHFDDTTLAKPGHLVVSSSSGSLPFTRSSSLKPHPLSRAKATPSRPHMQVVRQQVSVENPYQAPEAEIDRRRNFAIISHPDAGKTTLTEKMLMYGGAIQSAGAVRARANQRAATSDWMEIEKQRGISITSSVLTFEYEGSRVNLLDTPGHQDFSEDTYRTLAAADNAVMVVDGAKGLEPQTRKLFEVARMRKLPIFTFVNKMDRPSLSPFQIIDEIEKEFELPCCPMVWPIGDGNRFQGVVDIATNDVYLFTKGDRLKKDVKRIEGKKIPLDSPEAVDLIPSDLYEQVLEDVEIVREMTPPCNIDEVLNGDITPLFFGSAMNDFGIEVFLQKFLGLAQPPKANEVADGQIEANHAEFSALVFKLQANLNPKHRDCMAFARICSGTFKKGMKVKTSRLGGRQLTLSQAQLLFASERDTVDTAYPGDVIGLNNPGIFAIGDTLFTGSKSIRYPGIPSFSPEMFMYIKSASPGQKKAFDKGLQQLLDEGTMQLLRERSDPGNDAPIVAAVGQLQFDVVQTRLLNEYNVETKLEPLPYSVARWVTGGWDEVKSREPLYNTFIAKDRWDRPVLLFKSDWALNSLLEKHGDMCMTPWAFAPSDE